MDRTRLHYLHVFSALSEWVLVSNVGSAIRHCLNGFAGRVRPFADHCDRCLNFRRCGPIAQDIFRALQVPAASEIWRDSALARPIGIGLAVLNVRRFDSLAVDEIGDDRFDIPRIIEDSEGILRLGDELIRRGHLTRFDESDSYQPAVVEES